MIESEKIGKFGKLYNADCLQMMKEMPDHTVSGIESGLGLRVAGAEPTL